jgi:hypothetical protein
MKSIVAPISPQEIVNRCMHAVETVTHRRGLPILRGSTLDHFGFVVGSRQFETLRHEFRADVGPEYEFMAPEAGRAIYGVQSVSTYCWYLGNRFEALALVEAGRHFPVAVGGGYVAVRYRSEAHAHRILGGMKLEPVQCTLFGQRALRIEGNTPLGKSLYYLYIVFDDVLAATRGLASSARR